MFKREILEKEKEKLEKHGIIEKFESPFSSQLVLVQKKDLSWRLCADYRRLNQNTIKDAYPISRIDDNLDSLSGVKWFSSLDLHSAYYQIPLDPESKPKTAFATPRNGLHQYTVLCFGLCNSPASFTRIIVYYLLDWGLTSL